MLKLFLLDELIVNVKFYQIHLIFFLSWVISNEMERFFATSRGIFYGFIIFCIPDSFRLPISIQ